MHKKPLSPTDNKGKIETKLSIYHYVLCDEIDSHMISLFLHSFGIGFV